MSSRAWLSMGVIVLGLAGAAAQAAPRAELWPRWQAHDPGSTRTIRHDEWAEFLRRYLVVGDDGINRVAYGAVTPADTATLDAYIARLAEIPISRFNRKEQMAYWINLYNALTVRLVLAHHPVRSIRDIDISPGWFSDGPWGRKLVEVEGEPVSLDDIEHGILRPIWRDPRVHFVLNCAATGCPNLPAEPLEAALLERQLTRAAIAYVNDPRGVNIEDDRLVVSCLFRWYAADFGGSDEAIIAYLRVLAALPLAARLARFSSIDDCHYDWSLNETEAAPSRQDLVKRGEAAGAARQGSL